jgi:putative phosphoribosyl transferase
MERFDDRDDAGRRLAMALAAWRLDPSVVVVGLPCGGVPVAYQVAAALAVPLDILIVRKIGVPFHPEIAMGAIAEDGVVVVDKQMMAMAGVSEADFMAVERYERAELERRRVLYLSEHVPLFLHDKTVILVDDGIATGSTVRAACRVALLRGASRIMLGVPVASFEAIDSLRADFDSIVALEVVAGSFSVGEWYLRFDQTSDSEVMECLRRADQRTSHPHSNGIVHGVGVG